MATSVELAGRLERDWRLLWPDVVGPVRVRPVVNWGGFVNRSFRVDDGTACMHLKLSDDPLQHTAFRRWHSVARLLEERYLAPRLLGEVALPDTDFRGLLFVRVNGRPLSAGSRRLGEIVRSVVRLHDDRELARRLGTDRPHRTCRDDFLEDHARRFDADLELVEARRLPIAAPELLRWMREEARRVVELVERSPAFREGATRPIHGDLWCGNLLGGGVAPPCVLDWDELRLGDPALDLATLLAPPQERWVRGAWRRFGPDPEPACAERVDLLQRAHLLDWIIDPLADWAVADEEWHEPEEFRAVKAAEHARALAAYRECYG